MPNPVGHFEIYGDNPEKLGGSLDASLKQLAGLGGQILRPKSAVPKMGWFALVADPEMNVFGIWQDDPNAE